METHSDETGQQTDQVDVLLQAEALHHQLPTEGGDIGVVALQD